MVNIIDISDFSGEFFLSENKYNEEQIQDVINKYTKKYLVKLIGIELYNDFNVDYQTGLGTPTQDRWVKFYSGEIYEPENSITDYKIEYEGIKAHLVPLIYAKLMRDPAYTSDTGYVDGMTDGAMNLNLTRTKNKADNAWNEGCAERIKCARYLYNYDDIYEDFEYYYVIFHKKATVKTETLR